MASCPSKTPTPCFGGCYDLKNSNKHCGSCGNACKNDESCVEGKCVAGPKKEPVNPTEAIGEVAPETSESGQEKTVPEKEPVVPESERGKPEVVREEKVVVADESVQPPDEKAPPEEKVQEQAPDAGEVVPEKVPDKCKPETEVCNGLDDDCDGSTDEGFPDLGKPCSAGRGICKKTGKYICSGDRKSTICNAVKGTPSTEKCNGFDDNCDGQIDENLSQNCYGGGSGTQGTGLCKAGKQTCSAGNWGACIGEVKPTTELCDGKDNDCDGSTDEDFTDLGNACSLGKGICKGSGKYICSKDNKSAICNAVEGKPLTEVCNGLDDDCDGSTDEDFKDLGNACSDGQGGCKRTGKYVCSKDNKSAICNAVKGQVATETCNNVDDDCDGKVDEEVTQSCYTAKDPKTKGVGECKGGKQTCAAGKWGTCAGEITPKAETCTSGKDFNCDGVITKQCTWVKQSTPAGARQDKVLGMTEDSAGNVYIVAYHTGQTSFAGTTFLNTSGGHGLFVVKLDKAGKLIWKLDISGGASEGAFPGINSSGHIGVDKNGNVYVAGAFNGTFSVPGITKKLTSMKDQPGFMQTHDIFLLKLDSKGKPAWLEHFGSNDEDYVNSLAVDGSGAVYLCGSAGAGTLFGRYNIPGTASYTTMYLVKIDSNKSVQWLHTFKHPQSYFSSVVFDGKSHIYILGMFTGLSPSNPEKLRRKVGKPIEFKGDGGVGIVAKLDLDGNFEWAKPITFPNSLVASLPLHLTLDSKGNLFFSVHAIGEIHVGGVVALPKLELKGKSGDENLSLIKLDNSGKPSWGKSIAVTSAGNSELYISGLQTNTKDELYILGAFQASITGGALFLEPIPRTILRSKGQHDFFLFKMNTTLKKFTKAEMYGGTRKEIPTALLVKGTGEVKVAGSFDSSSLTLGPYTIKISTGQGPLTSSTFVWSLSF